MEISISDRLAQAESEFGLVPLSQANQFFEKFGVGNTLGERNFPYERFSYYETLLQRLMKSNYSKYQIIHKGTLFYYLAWLAFDIRNYEKATFYIDAALSEDIRASKPGTDWELWPASKFLVLDNVDIQVAQRTIDTIRSSLIYELQRFNSVSTMPELTIDIFINRFILRLLRDNNMRTIASAFYVFLLEFSERREELDSRSIEGGTMAPFVLHLFSGALIFESLLKNIFPTQDNGQPVEQLGHIFNNIARFRNTYASNIRSRSSSLLDIITGATDNTIVTSFSTIVKIRNTTGHNLVWDNSFTISSNYEILFQQEINSIFYIVLKSF